MEYLPDIFTEGLDYRKLYMKIKESKKGFYEMLRNKLISVPLLLDRSVPLYRHNFILFDCKAAD